MKHFDVIIVGAGISGIGTAYHLQTRSPERSYAILEARDAIGGTWDLFRYPGVRSDSDMYTFGFAFRPWTDGKVFADGPSIRDYVRQTAADNGIDQHIRFGRRMVSADFDTARACWQVEVQLQERREYYTCNFLVNCSGYYRYDHGYEPHFPGVESFQGTLVHPQKWPSDLNFDGQRVIVVGSGATAVTMVPAMAERARHVTMLQRSPTYIAAWPSRDRIADRLRRFLPAGAAHRITRLKNVLSGIVFYELSQRRPDYVRNGVLNAARKRLGGEFDVERHFSPAYNPWNQRFCLAPDGDFFDVLASGDASIVTEHIDSFTPDGIRLKSGEHLEADIVVSATGLEMLLFGGAELRVDGTVLKPSERFTYRGMMLSEVPNFAVAFGYTNASWTLKVDLTAERVCRTLNYMKRKGYAVCVPTPPADIEGAPLLDFSSGYVQRALPGLPQQGTKPPWRTYQNYIQDMIAIRYGRIDDGHMRFVPQANLAEAPNLEAA